MKSGWMARRRDSLHDALYDAMLINDAQAIVNGRLQVVWEIEGDDGSRLGREEIKRLILQKRQELLAKPPQKY